ncbi:FAD-dependent oxidoreductase, partial [Pseudomonas sp. SWRI111]
FTVCGSGFTGIEMVGELIEWKERLAKDYKLDAKDITLYVVEAAPTILNMLERRDADKAESYMVKQGVKILKSSPIVEVKEDAIVLKSGEELPTYTLILTAGVRANSDTKDYG